MSFTGKATYSAGETLPELVEDVADIIGIVSPYETPLLDAMGDPAYAAASTCHEWLEDELLPNKDQISDSGISEPDIADSFDVAHSDRFRIGDEIQIEGSGELLLVTAINGNTITVNRGYGGSTSEDLADGQIINILGNAALEGADRPTPRFTTRQRRSNFTQIFTAAVQVSGSDLAARQHGINSEMDYQKQERLRELLRDLENTIINGAQPLTNPQGTSSVRRSLKGIFQHITTHGYYAGDSELPEGTNLSEDMLNTVLRYIWEASSGNVDLIVVNGFQKRKINAFLDNNRSFGPNDQTYTDMVSMYESDFGRCRVLVSRWMPQDAVLLLDSSRLAALPLAGRSFHYKPLAPVGDYECGQLIGEYTLEMKNEQAHGFIRGLSTS